MSNATVRSMTSPESATLEDAKKWIKSMGEKGIYPATSARFRISALETFGSVLGDDEPKDAKYMLDHLDEIASRWATLNSNPKTATDYRSRARTALTDFMSFLSDPVNFRASRRERVVVGGKPKASTSQAQPPSDAAREPAQPQAHAVRSFPVGTNGEAIEFVIPASGFTVHDALRFAIHVATLASDFDPTSAMSARVFALARAEEK
jgi:hypothetical protein